MSDHSLPKTVDPLKYADQQKHLAGTLKVSQMPRVVEILAEDSGILSTELSFGRDEQGLRMVKGSLKADVVMTCERCLEPVPKTVESQFELGIVLSDEDAKQLPGRYEPLLVEPELLDIWEVIEEELMLSLPMFAYHEECRGEYEQAAPEAAEEKAFTETDKKENPFSVLSDLKLKK